MSRLLVYPGNRPGKFTVYIQDEKGVNHKLPDEIVEEAMLGSRQYLPSALLPDPE